MWPGAGGFQRQSAFLTEDATYSLRLIWGLKLGRCMEYTQKTMVHYLSSKRVWRRWEGWGGKGERRTIKTITAAHWALRQEKPMCFMHKDFCRDLFQYLFNVVKNKPTQPKTNNPSVLRLLRDRDLLNKLYYSHTVKCQAVIKKKMYLEEYWRHTFLKGGRLVLRRLKES